MLLGFAPLYFCREAGRARLPGWFRVSRSSWCRLRQRYPTGLRRHTGASGPRSASSCWVGPSLGAGPLPMASNLRRMSILETIRPEGGRQEGPDSGIVVSIPVVFVSITSTVSDWSSTTYRSVWAAFSVILYVVED